MSSPLEFSRPLTLDAARRTRTPVVVEANAAERVALARRFDLLGLDMLSATLAVSVTGDVIMLSGPLSAQATQRCVATDEPVPALIDEAMMLRCVPSTADAVDPDAEIELSDEDCDIIDYDGGAIDLGELVAQSFALALDPWPRSAGAEAALKAAGVKSEGEAGAFGALAALKDKLSGS
jgi:uncharacterized metal-binding protein YceD (DUF177 family)